MLHDRRSIKKATSQETSGLIRLRVKSISEDDGLVTVKRSSVNLEEETIRVSFPRSALVREIKRMIVEGRHLYVGGMKTFHCPVRSDCLVPFVRRSSSKREEE